MSSELSRFLVLVTTISIFLSTDQVSGASRNNDRESSLSKLIYEKIHGSRGCFRRMNGTHQMGCASGFNGNVGVVHLVESSTSINWVLEKGPHAPYIALLKPESFTFEILQRLQSVEGRVNGLLLLTNRSIAQFSTDSKCPNNGYGYQKSKTCYKWNAPGTDMMHHDWSFPIFLVENEKSVESLISCYNRFNRPTSDGTPREWPLCAAELHEVMLAAVNSETCMRRTEINANSITPTKICDPIGDMNIHATLIPSLQSQPFSDKGNRSVIVIGARMDASSFFDNVSPGADSAATGLTAVLALIKELEPLKEFLNSSKISNIFFILFNGEAFDYTGSGRLVYDMLSDNFPVKIESNTTTLPATLKMEDIKYYIELGQIYPSGETRNELFIHRNWDAQLPNSDSIDQLVQTLQQNTINNLKLTPVQRSHDWPGVPPSSLQSFLKRDPNFPGIVITNHQELFQNKYYNSIYDDAENIGYKNMETDPVVEGIANLVATITRTLESIVGAIRFSNTANKKLVNNVLNCYVGTAKCSLFQNVTGLPVEKLPETQYPLYVGVSSHTNEVTQITTNVMAYYQGSVVNRAEKDCKHKDEDMMNINYLWMNGSCYETTARQTPAISPAFLDIDTYDWKSGEHPTWTESVWPQQTMTVRIFLKPSFTHEILTLLLGLTVFIGSWILFSWIHRKRDVLFKSRMREGIC